MSRIRTIKPEFFLDDELAELPPLTRLLFIGLWTIADCAGRMEDRPKRIKAQVLPFDNSDPEEMLKELHDAKFILRYRVDGKAYINVVNFTKHQRLSGIEAQTTSDFPSPNEAEEQPKKNEEAIEKQSRSNEEAIEKQSRSNEEAIEKQSRSNEEAANVQEGKGKERKGIGKEKTIAAPENDSTDEKPAASAAVRFDAAAFLIEQGADPQTAADYLTLRKSKKAASTVTAMRGLRAQADKAGMTVQAVLEKCCARGWAGFEAKWVDDNARDGPRQTIHDQRKATLDELTGRTRNATQKFDPSDITAEVIRIA